MLVSMLATFESSFWDRPGAPFATLPFRLVLVLVQNGQYP